MVKNYEELNELQLDAIKEVTSIGAGNAATAISSLLNKSVKIEVPSVRLLDFNEGLNILGGPEVIAGGIMVRLSGDMKGIILYFQGLNFVNAILESVFSKTVAS